MKISHGEKAEGAKKPYFIEWNTEYSTTFLGNREFGRPRSGIPPLIVNRTHIIPSVVGELTTKKSMGSSSARETGRIAGIPETSIRRILHGILNMHPYKIQALITGRYRWKTKLCYMGVGANEIGPTMVAERCVDG